MHHNHMLKVGRVCLRTWLTLAVMALAVGSSWADPVSLNSTCHAFGPFECVDNTGALVYDGSALSSDLITLNNGAKPDFTFGPFEFINNTGQTAYDLHTTWSGTGGLSNGRITLNGGPGGATIDAQGNMVTVTWDDGGLENGRAVAFTMEGEYQANFADGWWSDKSGNNIGSARPVPEPATILLLGTALLAFASRLKVKSCGWPRLPS